MKYPPILVLTVADGDISIREMDRQSYCLAHGANMVRQYVLELCASGKLSSRIWTRFDDGFRCAVKHAAADQSVFLLLKCDSPSYVCLVLISILSNTFARIDAVRGLYLIC